MASPVYDGVMRRLMRCNGRIDDIREIGNEVGGPGEVVGVEPGFEEVRPRAIAQQRVDHARSCPTMRTAPARRPSPSSNKRLPRRDWQ